MEDQIDANDLDDYVYYTSGTFKGLVCCGTVYIGSSNTTTKSAYNPKVYVTLQNVRRVNITGYVWVDAKDSTKADDTTTGGYNSLLDSKETRVSGVTVTVRYKDDDEEKYHTTTDDTGFYEISCSLGGILIRDLDDYYIEFDYGDLTIGGYDGTEYIPVSYNGGTVPSSTSDIVTNSSKAMMSSVATKDVDLTGIATTYAGTPSNSETTYGLAYYGYNFKALYSENTLSNINLGIKKIYDPTYEIAENLLYVKIEINGYSYLYEYGYTEVVSGDPFNVPVPTVSFQSETSVSCYTRYMYPSDLKAGYGGYTDFNVYVVYGITIQNTTSYSVTELYKERNLKISNLRNQFDDTRYELDTSSNTDDDDDLYDQEKVCNDTFAYWSSDEKVENMTWGGASFDLTKYEITLTPYGTDGDSDTVYIQFKMTNNGIKEILESGTDGIIEDLVTRAYSIGYHTYTRFDYSWNNGITTTQIHYSKRSQKSDDAPYLRFVLGSERTLSGTVFEDEDEDGDVSAGYEVVGDGIYDSDNENTVKNVTVELLDASDLTGATPAKVYTYSSSTGASYDNIKSITTTEDGSFTFKGFIPDDYYLKFTYEDGTSEIYSYNSSTNTYTKEATVYLNDYKSTIVVSEEVIKAINNKYGNTGADGYTDEWYKYFDNDLTTYSVAVDDLDSREEYNQGLVYTYTLSTDSYGDETGEIDSVTAKSYDSSGNEITSMIAETATFSITIENTEETYSSAVSVGENEKDNITHENVYEGFNFGIITQPEQSVEVSKIITNVSMVNTPTTIFDGNPETDSLAGVSDMDFTTNEGSTYTRVEISKDSLYGSVLTVSYTISITNTSNLNYYETNSKYRGYYYMFGKTGDYSGAVEISIDSVLDAFDPELAWVIEQNGFDTWDYEVTSTSTTYSEASTSYLIEEDSSGNWVQVKDTTTDVEVDETMLALLNAKATTDGSKTYDFTEMLYMESWGNVEIGETVSVTVSFKKTLESSDDDMAYENVSGVNELSNNVSKTYLNNETATKTLKLVKQPQLPEPAGSYITISPPTGDDEQSIAMYVIAGAVVLVILSVGIVVIKKKIL